MPLAAVFLDRDGVLNRAILREGKPYAPMSPEDLVLLPGVKEACWSLKNAGMFLVMVTNQPEVARGRIARELVDAMNSTVAETLQLDAVKLCPHDDRENCACRKPRPGLLTDAAREFSIDLKTSYLVGDRWRDIAAGREAGCKTVFIDHDYRERRPDCPDFVTTSLAEAAQWIQQDLQQTRRNL